MAKILTYAQALKQMAKDPKYRAAVKKMSSGKKNVVTLKGTAHLTKKKATSSSVLKKIQNMLNKAYGSTKVGATKAYGASKRGAVAAGRYAKANPGKVAAIGGAAIVGVNAGIHAKRYLKRRKKTRR